MTYNNQMIDFAKIHKQCIRCGLCSKKQQLEGMPPIMVGALADELRKATALRDLPAKTIEFIRSCNLCDACTARCPKDISCGAVVRTARQKLLELDPAIAGDYRSYRVDYRESLFNCLRKAGQITYPEFFDTSINPSAASSAPKYRVSLFMPGCTLCSYSQPLTMATFDLLLNRGAVDGMTAHCCGNPLNNFGENGAYQTYVENFTKLLERNNVRRVVMACPNCMYSLEAAFKEAGVTGIELVPLPELLVEMGIRYSGPQSDQPVGAIGVGGRAPWDSFSSFCIHDSCPDRFTQRFGRATRQLFEVPGVDVLEMHDHGLNTICCGSGGLAAVYSRHAAYRRQERRLDQFVATAAECLVCYCISCANMFVSSPTRPQVRHYLELICKVQLDWEAMGNAINTLQHDPNHPLTHPLTNSTPVFDNLSSHPTKSGFGGDPATPRSGVAAGGRNEQNNPLSSPRDGAAVGEERSDEQNNTLSSPRRREAAGGRSEQNNPLSSPRGGVAAGEERSDERNAGDPPDSSEPND
jgi:Fe-S oxidoreductase